MGALGTVFVVYWFSWVGFVVLIGGGLLVALVVATVIELSKQQSSPARLVTDTGDPLQGVLEQARVHGGGVYLGVDARGHWRSARPERAVLVLGPPRSGKSSGVIMPALLSHAGPAVSTSTKADVLSATVRSRARLGVLWQFDPTGTTRARGCEQLHWSPVACSRSWDGALLMARAMVTATGVGAGTTDQTHWAKRSQALLAPLLHAAAVTGRNIEHVLDWVLRHELDEPGMLLDGDGSPVASSVLAGVQNTEIRERSSIFSTATDALDAYTSEAALAVAHEPNFDARGFVRSQATIYINAPAEHQAAAAPLVCGLLAEIRREIYHAHRDGELAHSVLFALDEAANIAPVGELPAIASEGGSQGLALLAAFQDLSQARARWGPAAEGFLTLFGAKLILPGIADSTTLETISLALGEYDREVVATTTHSPNADSFPFLRPRSKTVSTQRQRVLSPGEVANIPTGHTLYLDGVRWELLTLTLAHQVEPWKTLTQLPTPTAR